MYEEAINCPVVLPMHSDTQPSYHELRKAPLKSSHINDSHVADPGLEIPGTRFSMSSFSVPTREHRTPQQSYRNFNAPPTQMQGILPGQGWGEKYPGRPDGNALNHMINCNAFDTEMSSDHTSDRHQSLSNHPTPTTSHHGSSNTSYSPQNNDDVDPSHHNTESAGQGATTSFFNSSAPFAEFNPAADAGFTQSGGRNTSEANHYAMPSVWEIGQDPDISTSGLSPLGDAGWRNMLEGMGWDESTVGVDPSWRPQITDTHDR